MIKPKPSIRKGQVLHYNVAVQKRYSAVLEQMTDKMTKSTKKEIHALFSKKTAKKYFKTQNKVALDDSLSSQARILVNRLLSRFQQLFNKTAKQAATDMMKNTQKVSATILSKGFKQFVKDFTLKTSIVSTIGQERSQAIVNENVSLIRSIPSQYFTDIAGAVMRSISVGEGLKELLPAIEKYNVVSKRRAQLIALDQTRKAYNAINRQRMMDLGLNKFIWRHSGGGQHPRQSHIAMDGKLFSFDDLPIINKENLRYEPAQRGIPGDAPNCRCTMRMVAPWDLEEGK